MAVLSHQTLHLLCRGGLRQHTSLGLHRGRDQGQSLQEGKAQCLHGGRRPGQSLQEGSGRVQGRGHRRQRVCGPQIGSVPAGELAQHVAPDLATGNPRFNLNGVVHQMHLHYPSNSLTLIIYMIENHVNNKTSCLALPPHLFVIGSFLFFNLL